MIKHMKGAFENLHIKSKNNYFNYINEIPLFMNDMLLEKC